MNRQINEMQGELRLKQRDLEEYDNENEKLKIHIVDLKKDSDFAKSKNSELENKRLNLEQLFGYDIYILNGMI